MDRDLDYVKTATNRALVDDFAGVCTALDGAEDGIEAKCDIFK